MTFTAENRAAEDAAIEREQWERGAAIRIAQEAEAQDRRDRELAEDIDVARVLVNQAHTFGNGGGFDNGLPFTLSMGCGTWQGNSLSENLNWRCFVNITHLVTTIPEDKPSEDALFGAYWAKYGK